MIWLGLGLAFMKFGNFSSYIILNDSPFILYHIWNVLEPSPLSPLLLSSIWICSGLNMWRKFYTSNEMSTISDCILKHEWLRPNPYPKMVRKVKICLQILNIAWRCFMLLKILIRIVGSIVLLNSQQIHQKLYSDSLYVTDITCCFL